MSVDYFIMKNPCSNESIVLDWEVNKHEIKSGLDRSITIWIGKYIIYVDLITNSS